MNMHKKKVLIPLPRYGCDPSEVAIPWLLLNQKKFEITFITPDGKIAITDDIMLTGKNIFPYPYKKRFSIYPSYFS